MQRTMRGPAPAFLQQFTLPVVPTPAFLQEPSNSARQRHTNVSPCSELFACVGQGISVQGPSAFEVSRSVLLRVEGGI